MSTGHLNIKQNTSKRVSDIISKEDICSWDDEYKGCAIIIEAGCDTGKSYFIKNKLYEEAKRKGQRILFLIHRSLCTYQFSEEVKRDKKASVIDVMTYQSIETGLIKNSDVGISRYKYIVCDEFHYFLADAEFNDKTDISFEYILNQPEQTIKIFMSATSENMVKYINEYCHMKAKTYSLPKNFSHIGKLVFFHRNEMIDKILQSCIESREKAMVFIQSAQQAHELSQKYSSHSLFNCSKSNQRYFKSVDEGRINEMLRKQRFDEQFLISTTCFDAGSNILDEDVKHIILDITDLSSLIQCIGRRRVLHDGEQINVYIKSISNKRLGGLITRVKKQVEMAEYLLNHTLAEFHQKYPRTNDKSNIIYTQATDNGNSYGCELKVNKLKYQKKQDDILFYQEILYCNGTKVKRTFGYCEYLAKLFGFYDRDKRRYLYEVMSGDSSLDAYLESQAEKPLLQVKDRRELIEAINARSNGKQIKSLDKLNDALKSKGSAYRITKRHTSTMVDGKQKKYPSTWLVQRLCDWEKENSKPQATIPIIEKKPDPIPIRLPFGGFYKDLAAFQEMTINLPKKGNTNYV